MSKVHTKKDSKGNYVDNENPQKKHSQNLSGRKESWVEIFEEELGERYKKLEDDGKLLEINDMRKEFGKFTAVNDVSMKMFEGEIFALLGHNGAGKTTTISMVTGLIMPTSGSGSFRNVDLFGQMRKIRTTLGVCPQLDVLFEDMTVREHLEM